MAMLTVCTACLTAACGSTPVSLTCTTNAQCYTNSGYACDTAVTKTCLATCTTQTDCLDSEYCDTTDGLCRFGSAPTP